MSEVDRGAPDSEGESEAGEEGRAGDTTEKLGSSGGGGKMLLVGHDVLLLLVALVFWALITAGHGLKAPKQSGGGAKDARSQISADKIIWKLLLAGIVILAVSRCVGGLLREVHQPHVIGEIIAGILVGPSLLGAIWPSAFDFVFPPELMSQLDVLAQVGLIFYMFLVGLELDFGLMRGRGHAATPAAPALI